MYTIAYKVSEEVVFYFDCFGNTYTATGGSLAWRLNNPGLIPSRSRFARLHGSIGHSDRYAIFPDANQGRRALMAWLLSSANSSKTILELAKYYCPETPQQFADSLVTKARLSVVDRIDRLSREQLERFISALCKQIGYSQQREGVFLRLPKIAGKVEYAKENLERYLLEDYSIVTLDEAINRIQTFRLDAVVVHGQDEKIYLRSRPCHRFVVVHLPTIHLEYEEPTVIERVVGEKDGKYIWAFINGIDNSRKEALASAELIASYACDEKVFALQNDTLGFSGILDFLTCLALKSGVNMPVIKRTATFLRHLLFMSQTSNQPVIIFVHSQGAIIIEQALSLLKKEERELLRIFTFGGGSMIPSGMCHPDSHNFANVRDFVCMLGSPNWQILALEKYHGQKQGKTEKEILWDLSMRDALLKSDSLSQKALEAYAKGRIGYYEKVFNDIKNLTVLDFEAGAFSSHEFKNEGYQTIVKKLIKEYRESMK